MTFIKWPGIENSYRQKNIDWWLKSYPELTNERYIVTEKIHGSNLQWFIQPNKPIQAGSRNQWLDIKRSFNGANIQELLKTEQDILTSLQEYADKYYTTFRLFGELFGGNIQKGVDYGKETCIFVLWAYDR